MSLGDFFHMGGYAFHIWTSYGIALVILVANLVVPWKQKQKLLRRIRRAKRRSDQA